jgi:asparagine synthase (glutamine-hydrolysing)
MGMRRLSIIDIKGGDQPIFNEDQTRIIMYNGEIYNFVELRKELEPYGHTFKTHSDTEVIVHAYEQWEQAALQRLNGMFALALWDKRRRQLLLARDHLGKKPLYYHFSSQGLLWASEIKALLAVPWVEKKINPEALHHYLSLQYVPDPLTIYEGIYQLPAAHILLITGEGQPRITPWWQLNFEPKLNIDESEAIEQARQRLGAAVERRLLSEVPLGAFLSGGLDSSIVVALMADRLDSPVKTFSIGFEEPRFSEISCARLIAQRYRTDHHEFVFRPPDLRKVVEDVITAVDQPFADPAALPFIELARQARSHVTVVLTGDGGDETLAGYLRYVLDRGIDGRLRLPFWLAGRLLPLVTESIPDPAWIPEDRSPLGGLKKLGQALTIPAKASILRWGSYFTHAGKLALYQPGWRQHFTHTHTEDQLSKVYDSAPASSPLDRTLYTDQSTYLASDLLLKTDRMSMAHSLEARAPLLDIEWVEWTARLPEAYKLRGLQTKWLLRQAFTDLLPPALLKRSKQGFSVPVGSWIKDELNDWTRERLFANPMLEVYFSRDGVNKLFEQHMAGNHNHGKRLWALLMFSLWLEGIRV